MPCPAVLAAELAAKHAGLAGNAGFDPLGLATDRRRLRVLRDAEVCPKTPARTQTQQRYATRPLANSRKLTHACTRKRTHAFAPTHSHSRKLEQKENYARKHVHERACAHAKAPSHARNRSQCTHGSIALCLFATDQCLVYVPGEARTVGYDGGGWVATRRALGRSLGAGLGPSLGPRPEPRPQPEPPQRRHALGQFRGALKIILFAAVDVVVALVFILKG